MLNPRIAGMRLYSFDRKRQLFENLTRPIVADLTIGEPQHEPDPQVVEILNSYAAQAVGRYPKTKQEDFLTQAIIEASVKTKKIFPSIGANQLLAGCGSGELLYSIAAGCIDPAKPYILIPNPAYQVYMFAAEFAGGIPYYFDLKKENGFQPDFAAIPKDILARTSLCYLNNPNNPTAVCYSEETLRSALRLARKYDFVLASDECYIDIYFGDKPHSMLEICAKEDGDNSFSHVVVFESLSKRSSLPGLRSGAMIGDSRIVSTYLKLRMSERKVLPIHVQRASAFAWTNLADVDNNRALYLRKRTMLAEAMSSIGWDIRLPDATFYGWLDVSRISSDDESTAIAIAKDSGVLTFPGSYFSVERDGVNPGAGFLRIALIETVERTEMALAALVSSLKRLDAHGS